MNVFLNERKSRFQKPGAHSTILVRCGSNYVEFGFGDRAREKGRTYVPEPCRPRVTEWARTCPAAGHPGIFQSVELVQCKYWWPELRNVSSNMQSCAY